MEVPEFGSCVRGGVFVDAGTLIIMGPRIGNYYCFLGQTCIVTPINGEELSTRNRLMLVDKKKGAVNAKEGCELDASFDPVAGVPDRGFSANGEIGGSKFVWPSAPV